MKASIVLIYTALLVGLFIVYTIEKKDWTCTNSYDLFEQCYEGDGMPYRGSKPDDNDSTTDILDKINIAASTEENSIKWRRALLLSGVIVLLMYVLVITQGTLPSKRWYDVYTCIFIGFAVLYFSFNHYSYHRYSIPRKYINEHVDKLRV